MKIELDPRDESIIASKLKTGGYESPAEVVHAALGLLSITPRSMDELQGMVQEGLDDLDAGRVVDGKEAMKRLDAKYAVLEADQKKTA